MKREEGFIDVKGGKVWYEIVGETEKIPLVTVHGGPAYPHDYLQPLETLADARKVLFYDQLGCGNSQKPTDQSLWTLERFVEELSTILKTFAFKKYILLGHSWGTMLTTSFALNKPEGLTALILSDPYLSTPLWIQDIDRLLQQFPEEMRKNLLQGDTESEAYHKALKEFFYQHFYRLSELPISIIKAENKMNFDIYNYMWGPAEFNPTGTLKGLDLTGRLSEIEVPVLLLCGRYDEATPESTAYFQSLLPRAQMRVFEKSAHFPHITETAEYLATLNTFLQSIDQ